MDIDRLKEALINADKAGDTAAATALAQELRRLQPPEPSTSQDLGRQAGLTARYAVEGPVQFATSVFGDPINTAINYGIRGVNAVAGTNIPKLGMPSRAAEQALDSVFPKPANPLEDIVGAASKAMLPAVGLSKLAAYTPAAIQAISPGLAGLATKPLTEGLSAMTGGAASESAKQSGAPPWVQALAGAAAPTGISALGSTAKMAAMAANEMRRPLTQAGANQIAADALGRLTSDKTTALDNLNRYKAAKDIERAGGPQVGVPGSQPTAGAVSADYGLIGGQQAIARGDAAPQFALQSAKNNAARLDDLAKLRANANQIAAYEARRDAVTGPLREQAFANAKGPVDYAPVVEKITALAASPAGGRVESQKALEWLAKRVEKYTQDGRVDPANAYALHQDIGALVAGKVRDDNGSALRLAGGLANDVKRTLAGQIEASAPGFQKYLETYSRLSKPIDRLQVIADRLGGDDLARVTNAGLEATAEGARHTLSQAKMRNAVRDIASDTRLAPRQSDILGRVLGDLNASELAARGGKLPGSDTYQNIASANLVNRILGQTWGESGPAKSVTRALGLAYRPLGLESRIQDLIVNAYQDPEQMARLLSIARTSRGSPTLAGLLNFAAPRATGGLLGSFAQ